MPSTSYMNLTLPTVGVTQGGSSSTSYGPEINAAFTAIDSHNHSTGQGVPITPTGMSINIDLPFGGNNATGLRTTRFQSQGSTLSLPTDLDCLYVVNNDLYFNDGQGNQIRITLSGAVNTSASGTITGLGGTTGAATYSSISGAFSFTQNTNQYASVNVGPVTISGTAANANGVTVQAPAGLASAYNFTLPTALPAATSYLTISAAGQVATKSINAPTPPTVSIATTSSHSGGFSANGSGTYTTPAGVCYIRVRMVGGGGGGAGSGVGGNGGTGGNGGATSFGTTFLTANGGNGGTGGTQTPGAGGSASIGVGGSGLAFTGANGEGGAFQNTSSMETAGVSGGVSPFGGAGYGGPYASAGGAAQANTGSGGGSGGCGAFANMYTGNGGGAGGFIDAVIASPSASYSFSIGSGGSGGTLGTNGSAGGAGAAGLIIVEEFYQ